MERVTYRELRVGDIVNLEMGAESLGDRAIVQKVDTCVHLARPWIKREPTGYLYIGVEHFTVFADSNREMLRIARGDQT